MTWIYPLSPETGEPASVIGAKAHGLVLLQRLGLPVPPGFVISTEACRTFLDTGRLPDDLGRELTAAISSLKATTVSVRSGSSVSMPGMMDTVLNLHPTPQQLERAVRSVFSSWNSPRARTYRELHDIPHDLGTAVTVQAMVLGNRDAHSGTGVAFSRNPNTGENTPFGDVLFSHQGEDLVSGKTTPTPLLDLAAREPAVWADLRQALKQIENHHRDACYVEFTYESANLWLLQARPANLVGRAAIRVAVELADEGVITRNEALLRVSPHHLQQAHTPQIKPSSTLDVLTRGQGACPGVAVGHVATTSERAVQMSADGPVILVRPQTSPLDMHGLAAASGILTARGGPTSHAAVVARSMGKPAVVGATALTVDPTSVRTGDRIIPEGTLLTIDGTSGEVVIGTPEITTAQDNPQLNRLLEWADELTGGS